MPWYDEFFDEYYNKTYTHLNRERTSREVDLIIDALEMTKEDLILDMPCGFGRHSIELTRRGYRVTGMEYNQSQIDRAKELMKTEGVRFEIIQADMRDIPHHNRYDKLYNYFTSFGYFDDQDNEKTLGSFHRALKPGGMLLIEMANRDWVIRNFQPSNVTHTEDGGFFLEERKYDTMTGRSTGIHTLIQSDGKTIVRKLEHRMYCSHELIEMFKRRGFEVVKLLGDNNREFKMFDCRLCVVGRKI